MPSCPVCEQPLETRNPEGWLCRCGELIAFGFEKEDEGRCSTCPVMQCPKRK
jgi:hypothetical protein